MHGSRHVLFQVAALVVAGCASTGEPAIPRIEDRGPRASVDLSSTLEPLARWFEEGVGSVRMVTLLAST